jgi:hypothetical protein
MKIPKQIISFGMKITAMLAIGALITLNACKEEEGTPSAPQLSTDASTLSIKLGETKTVALTISAAGKLKDIVATADKGTVTVAGITGVGESTATATLTYIAPQVLGTATISITVNDQSSQSVKKDIAVEVTAQPPVELTGGAVEGEWGPFRTYTIKGSLNVPAGKKLIVREGTTIIVDGDGKQGTSPEISVAGSFYSYGTEANPVLFTVPQAKRTKENIFAGLWGGILGTIESPEMAIIYTRIEYVGGPASAGTNIVTSGELKEGDPRGGLYYTNPNGKFVMQNSTIAYSKDDGMRVNQGTLLITNNTYILNGQTGGEALNVKSGCRGDVAFNTFYQAATNGIKWSNSDDRTPQTDVNVYNNTAINCGWRQTKSGRGGSFNLEKGGRGKVYNNIVVNCKFGVRFPKSPDNPDVANSAVGFNFYYGANDVVTAQFYPTSISTVAKGDLETANDVSTGTPNFVTLTVTPFDQVAAANPANMDFPAAFNLKLAAGSPALAKGKTGWATKFTSHSVDGKTYNVPAPANYIGAFGSN